MEIKRKLVIGTTALAAVAFGSGAYAATQDATNPRQAFLNDVAKRLKVSPRDLNTALQGAFFDQLQAAVKSGKLTQAQADQLKQRIQQRGAAPFAAPFFGPRFFGHGGFGGPGGGPGVRFGGVLGAAASYLGLSPAQLRDQLASGKSLAQVASAQHKSTSGLKAAITAEARSRLDRAVSAKLLTSAQEQQILTRLQAHLDSLVNQAGIGPRMHRSFGPGRYPGLAPPSGTPGTPGALASPPAPPAPPAY